MRSNGNCRGISYRGYAHTGNTATAVPVTVLNQLDVGEAPFPPPSPRSTIRSSRFGDSKRSRSGYRATSNPRFSRFLAVLCGAQKVSSGAFESGRKTRAPEKEEKRRGKGRRKKWLERDKKGEGERRGRRKKGRNSGKSEVEVRGGGGGKDWNCGCGGNAIHGGRGTDRYVAADRQLLWLQLELSGTSRQRASTEKSGTALLRIEATH